MSVGKLEVHLKKKHRPNNKNHTHTHTPLHLELEQWKSQKLNTSPSFPSPILPFKIASRARAAVTAVGWNIMDWPKEPSALKTCQPLGFFGFSGASLEEVCHIYVPKKYRIGRISWRLSWVFLVSYCGADQWKLSYTGVSGYSIQEAKTCVWCFQSTSPSVVSRKMFDSINITHIIMFF